MGLNLSALKEVQEDLNKRTSGGDMFLNQKDIKEETDVRILPPLPNMNGLYFVEQHVWWINNKSYISAATFGEDDVIAQIVEEAKEEAARKKDKELTALVNSDKLKKQIQYLIPILELEPKGDGVVVVGDKAKILNCGMMLLKAINKICTNRQYQNGTDDGVSDRVEGFNIILSKTKKGTRNIDVEYDAQGYRNPSEMPIKYYEKTPDVVKLVRGKALSDDTLREIIYNYLYGDPFPKEEVKRFAGEGAAEEEETDKKDTNSRGSRRVEEKRDDSGRASSRIEEAEKKEETGRGSSRGPRKEKEEKPTERGGARGTRRNVADDLNNVDD